MSSDVFTHPWLGGLFGDTEIAELLGPETVLANMLRVESAFSDALGSAGMRDRELASQVSHRIAAGQIDPSALRAGTARDGVPVPALVGLLKAQLPEALHPAIHTGLTSQDVIDTAWVLCLAPVLDRFRARLKMLIEALHDLDTRFGARNLMARTRMQAAMPVKAPVPAAEFTTRSSASAGQQR